jgi:hypothetical protein
LFNRAIINRQNKKMPRNKRKETMVLYPLSYSPIKVMVGETGIEPATSRLAVEVTLFFAIGINKSTAAALFWQCFFMAGAYYVVCIFSTSTSLPP